MADYCQALSNTLHPLCMKQDAAFYRCMLACETSLMLAFAAMSIMLLCGLPSSFSATVSQVTCSSRIHKLKLTRPACWMITGLGLAGAGRRFVEVMSLTWAYSQVTKLGRAGAALALAPIVDGCLLVIQCRLGLRSRAATFWLVVGVMLTFAAVLIGGVVAIWS